MKNIFLFLTLFCVVNISAETLSLNRTMSASDPNIQYYLSCCLSECKHGGLIGKGTHILNREISFG